MNKTLETQLLTIVEVIKKLQNEKKQDKIYIAELEKQLFEELKDIKSNKLSSNEFQKELSKVNTELLTNKDLIRKINATIATVRKSVGPSGSVGPEGPQGPQGIPGIQGPKGDKGDVGQKGDKGDTGLQGPQGLPGADGQDGLQGPQGLPGKDGLQGPKGDTGERGPAGANGYTPYIQDGYWYIAGVTTGIVAQGVDGQDGTDGYTPIKGVDYFDGATGPKGDTGPAGTTDYNNLTNKPAIPTQLSQLTDDSTHRLVTDTEKSTWNAKQPAGTYSKDIHSNITALNAVSGTNTGDQDLSNLVVKNAAITGATNTKITYDSKGLVTSGTSATTADIADSTNKRYVTDAQLTVIGNTSGTNTGDNATNSQYSGLATSKQDTLVSGTNIKTINGSSILGSGDLVVTAAASSPFTMYRRETDQISSSTTLADVTELSFNHTSGKIYRVEIIGAFRGAATTTGGKLAVYLPSGTGTIQGFMEGDIVNTAAATGLKIPIYAIGASNTTGSFLLTTGVTSTSVDQSLYGSMIFISTGSGVFRVQWASEVASSNATLRANSLMLVTQLN